MKTSDSLLKSVNEKKADHWKTVSNVIFWTNSIEIKNPVKLSTNCFGRKNSELSEEYPDLFHEETKSYIKEGRATRSAAAGFDQKEIPFKPLLIAPVRETIQLQKTN